MIFGQSCLSLVSAEMTGMLHTSGHYRLHNNKCIFTWGTPLFRLISFNNLIKEIFLFLFYQLGIWDSESLRELFYIQQVTKDNVSYVYTEIPTSLPLSNEIGDPRKDIYIGDKVQLENL